MKAPTLVPEEKKTAEPQVPKPKPAKKERAKVEEPKPEVKKAPAKQTQEKLPRGKPTQIVIIIPVGIPGMGKSHFAETSLKTTVEGMGLSYGGNVHLV